MSSPVQRISSSLLTTVLPGSDQSEPTRAYQNRSATQWLDQLGVPANVSVGNLSGGQKRRLAIARTLARSPDIILYDEPTSGLDAASGSKVAELIRETHRLAGRTSVIVTHDHPTLIPIADDICSSIQTRKLERLEHEQWKQVPERLQALTSPSSSPKPKNENPLTQFVSKVLDTTGAAVGTALILPLRMVPFSHVGNGELDSSLALLTIDRWPVSMGLPAGRWINYRIHLHFLHVPFSPVSTLHPAPIDR